MPDHVLARAQAHHESANGKAASHGKDASEGQADAPGDGSEGLTFEPLEIIVPKGFSDKNTRDIAQQVIGREVERYIASVQQGHRQGYANFRVWFRDWNDAKENSSSEIARKICGFLLEKGLEVIFPEEEVFIVILKTVATKGWDLGSDALSKVEAGKPESFLDGVWAAEEGSITALLDAHDRFFKEHDEEVLALVASYIGARDAGWESTEALPPETLEMLHGMGIGMHGSQAATLAAERVLAAHIDAVFHADEGTMQIAGGANSDIQAQISALKQMQSLPSVDHREEMWTLERRLPDMLRSMIDINNEPAIMLHIRLGIDQDDADKMVKSRDTVGPFSSSNDLLVRKLLSQEDLKKVEWRIVCH